MLNSDQQKGLGFIANWWGRKDSSCMVLDGRGGTGKTYLIDMVLKTLKGISPILLSPTNEAIKQIREKVEGDYLFRTVHSALGIAPTTNQDTLKFEHIAFPNIWENINLAIVDESSMLDDWLLEILLIAGVKILFIGHKSQLPPVKLRRPIFDKCISPVFERGYPTFTLTEPMRNTGALWDFNNLLEEAIYSGTRDIPNTFDITKNQLKEKVHSKEGIDSFLAGDTKIVLWSNDGVDQYNKRIRAVIHGEVSKEYLYLPNDRIILTAPYTAIDGLERYTDNSLKAVMGDKNLPVLYSNSKAIVNACIEVDVHLSRNLTVRCYKLFVDCEGEHYSFYSLVHNDDRERMIKHYDHIAWSMSNKQAKERAFKQKHFILSCFAQIKHYFACTSHRVQGCSIPEVIVINSDISKNMNRTEASKCRYVACSRTIDNLYFYRGV